MSLGIKAPRSLFLLSVTTLAWVLASAPVSGGPGPAPNLVPRQIIWGYADGASFKSPRGIAFDPADGAIYVGNGGEHRIDVFSRTGRPLSRSVHRVRRPDGTIVDGIPYALAVDGEGRLLVADVLATYVDVIDRRGRSVNRLDIPAGRASALTVGRDGTIYVGTMAESSKVHRFHPDYSPAGAWGEQGAEPGRLFNVTALAEMEDGTLAVSCGRTELGVQLFTPDGRFLRGFGGHDLGKGNVTLPSGLFNEDGRIWVLDEIRQNFQVFDTTGTFIEQVGGRGGGPGEFAYPSSLAFDGSGLVAVTEKETGRVQLFGINP